MLHSDSNIDQTMIYLCDVSCPFTDSILLKHALYNGPCEWTTPVPNSCGGWQQLIDQRYDPLPCMHALT